MSTKINTMTTGRFTIIRTVYPIRIKKGSQLKIRCGLKKKTKGIGMIKIPKYFLNSLPMRSLRIVHELIDSIDCKKNIKYCKGKVLEAAHYTAVPLKILKCITIKCSKRFLVTNIRVVIAFELCMFVQCKRSTIYLD